MIENHVWHEPCTGREEAAGTWWIWAPDRVNLLPWSWKVTGLLPWHDDTGRPAKEASWAMLTTSPALKGKQKEGMSKKEELDYEI